MGSNIPLIAAQYQKFSSVVFRVEKKIMAHNCASPGSLWYKGIEAPKEFQLSENSKAFFATLLVYQCLQALK